MADVGNANTVEGVAREVLGWGLGGGLNAPIKAEDTPEYIKGPQAPPWLERTYQADSYMSHRPPKVPGKLLFWRRRSGLFIERVEISLAGSGDAPTSGLTKNDTGATGGGLADVGKAWLTFYTEVPGLMGRGKVLDPQSIEETRQLFDAVAAYFEDKHTELNNLIKVFNKDDDSFRGSASETYAQRVGVAAVKVAGAKAQTDQWHKQLQTAATSAQTFVDTFRQDLDGFAQAMNGTLLNPHNFMIYVLNHAGVHNTLSSVGNLDYGLADISEVGTHTKITGEAETNTPTFLITLPPEVESPAIARDVFNWATWPAIDQLIREAWAFQVEARFTSTILAYRTLVLDLQNAAALLNPPKIGPNPKIVPPTAGGDDDSGGSGLDGINDKINKGLNDLGNGMNGLNNNLNKNTQGLDDSLDGLNDNLNKNTQGLDDSLNGLNKNFATAGGAANGLDTGGLDTGGLDDGGFDTGSDATSLDGADNLGDLSSDQLGALQDGGLLDGTPLTTDQAADLAAAGMPVAAGATLGSLSTGQLNQLKQDGLLDDQPVTSQEASALQAAGLGDGLTDNGSLGDLSSQQLTALQNDGQLDDTPLSAGMRTALQQAGIPAGTADSLGDLTSTQLGELQQDGLLDNVPVTSADAASLQAAGLGSDLGSTSVTDPTGSGFTDTNLGSSVASSQFPTPIDAVDVSSLGTGADTSGYGLGDVSQPVAHLHSGGDAGITGGGFGTSNLGVSGGSGTGSGLSPSTVTSDAPLALGNSAFGSPTSSPVTSSSSQLLSSGAPMMGPPMGGMGGMGGGPGGNNEKSRERSTWLTEDEDVWGTDPDCAPAVVGRGDDLDVDVVDVPTVPGWSRPTDPREDARRSARGRR